MYSPRAFVENDPAALDALFAHAPFVTLVSDGAEGFQLSHLPVLYRREDQAVLLEGHWARPNPQAGAERALAIVHGPHAYVSPSWYPDKLAASRVPTWNYAVAHLHGRLQRFDDEAGLAALVQRQSAHFEALAGSDWQFDAQDARQRAQLRGIVGFRLLVDRIEMKFKLSQNHPAANVAAVIDALEAGGEQPRAVAALMRARASRAPGLE